MSSQKKTKMLRSRNLLGEADNPPARSGKPVRSLVVRQKLGIEVFAEGAILGVEGVLEFPLSKPLLFDQPEEPGTPAVALNRQRVAVKQTLEQEAVEARVLGVRDQRRPLKQVAPG